jgi:flagellar motor switch protein FliG
MVFTFFKPFALSTKDLVGVLGAKTSEGQGQDRAPEMISHTVAEEKSREKKDSPWSDPARKPPFWFITPEKAGNLGFILRTKTVEDITRVLSYAPEAVSAALIEALYPKSIEALAGLPKVTLMPEVRIKTLESELFSALDYVVGSEDKTMNIVEQLPENMQDKAVLSLTAQNPAFSQRLSSGIVRFGDIRNLEDIQAQMLVRRIPMRNLALALKNSDLAQVFTKKLSEGMQERFRQELDLTRNPAPEVQRAERVRVAQELKKLVKEGFIVLGKAGPASPKAVPTKASDGAKPAQPATAPKAPHSTTANKPAPPPIPAKKS